jgi:hypothetical protein
MTLRVMSLSSGWSASLQVIQADIARRYIDGELEFARAVSELEELALVPHAETIINTSIATAAT